MKIATIVFFNILLLASCNSHSGSSKTTDSIPINTTETNKSDGGPNNGLGDTNTINRGRDTASHDTLNKK
jgi:hypothetical protein